MSVTAVSPTEVGVEVGTFFYSSWGYDQTNVDFYKVVGTTPKGVKVQKWTSATVDSGESFHDSVVPGGSAATYMDWSACTPEMDYWARKEAVVEREVPVETKRVQSSGPGRCYIKVGHNYAWVWDGSPQYQTAAGYGH